MIKKIFILIVLAISISSVFLLDNYGITNAYASEEFHEKFQENASERVRKNNISNDESNPPSGGALIWFICAVAFLKVSTKLDSIMSSLGINVAHTGSNLLGNKTVMKNLNKSI